MRWLRLLSALGAAVFRRKLTPADVSRVRFRVWLTDIDATVMNHAAMLTVMEMGRLDFLVRSGFFRLARKKKWFFPSRSVSAQFMRPLKLWQKATLYTRLLHADDKWFYIEQEIIRNGKSIATCVVKGMAKNDRETVPTQQIAAELGFAGFPTAGEDLVAALSRFEDCSLSRIRSWQGSEPATSSDREAESAARDRDKPELSC